MTDDPFRPDAAIVYRYLRDHGPVDAISTARACFPFATEGPASSILAIQRRSLRRVYDSIVWMRHHGVAIKASVDEAGTSFALSASASETSVSRGTSRSRTSAPDAVTDKVAQPETGALGGEAMGLWHASDEATGPK